MKQRTLTKRIAMTLLLGLLTLGVQAQVTIVDDHYVDPKQGMEANPTGNPDWSLMQGVSVKKTVPGKRNAPIANATSYGLPDHVNNGANKYFRSPVANQSGNSCGITSRHSHMMAYELNAYRDKDGSLAENMLPAHFAFVPAYREDPNKENYAKYVGVPDGVTFGGTNVSTIYGGPYSESSNNYGRMQGYENWHKAMFNRITDNPNFPLGAMTEEGALAWKRWLYNHNGDESFHAGGVIGVGLASSGLAYTTIPSTTANDNAGVTGMYYLTHWGTGVDHAMVVVGYDDRIEFDLDGDGTKGSSSNKFGQNETGAWILANSWGSSWCNNGFLYVPYALGSPTSTSMSKKVGTKTYTGYQAGDANGWTGEIYKIRKDYTPIRTLKAAVAYSKRSEIQICVGISTNLSASSPDKTLVLANHNYHGDYDGNNTDAEVPMLGQWTDGKLHTEAMEFGYDLTDFTDEFDRHVPLKYFLIINTKDGASGTGKIEYASIMDYELNANGVETPFASKNVTITNNGGTTTISTVVYGEELPAPANLALSSTTLSWDAPQGAGYTPTGYNIYQDGEYVANTTSRSYNIGAATGSFYVTACYTVGGVSSESSASNIVYNNLSASNFISYIGDPITAVSQLTSGMYVVLKCYGQGKYVYDNSSAYLLTSTAPETLNTDYYKYVFKVTKSSSTYTFQSVNGYLPTLSQSTAAVPSNSAGSYTVTSQGENTFSLRSSVYLNGTASSTVVGYGALDNNDKYFIYPVNVSITSSNTLNVSIVHPATVYSGVPVQLSLEGAADIVSATWTVDGTNYSGLSPYVTFSSAGSKSVSCTATDSKNHSKTVSKTITVSVPSITANFTLSSESTTGSDRISFLCQNTVPGCTYSWSMPGAEEETATTRNASATYLSTGEKTVTLTVTDPNNNSVSHSETFMVNASSPKSRYTISPAIVVKNNPVTLTDNSLYNPTSWSWRFDSDNNRISCTTQNGTITPTKAGVYKLTFGTGNAEGSNFVETERALIVCNSASGNGLTFAGGNQNVTATMSSSVSTAWTIDFWFNPSSLGATTQGITGSNTVNSTTRSFTITSSASGVATLTVGSSSVSTDAAFYIANEWHHYAITFSSGTVKFYRDGNLIGSKSVSTTNFSNYFKSLQFGGTSAPMSGSIDEFRVWSTTLSQANIRSYCVAPISASTSGLKLYWQMNQGSGNVTDATSNGVTGTRNNFNNDGDAWTDSEGVFALDFSDASTPSISDSQLNHYYDNVYSVSDEQDGSVDRSSLGMAFDGNTSTYYQSQWEIYSSLSEVSYPHSFILRRGALHEVTAFSIVSNTTPTNTVNAASSVSSGRAKYVTIEESDDALNWNLVDKEVRLYDLATNNVILPWPITKEYVRFTFSEPIINDGSYVALLINEMNFYGTAHEPTKTEVPLTYVACSDESTVEGDTQPGGNALDGDAGTFWHSSWYGTATTYPHSITVENADLSGIDMFYFYQQHSYSGNQSGEFRAGVMNVETSSNNSTWATVFEGLRIPYGNTGYVKLPETINARYIKLTFTRNQSSIGDGTYLAMNEIQAYGMVVDNVTVTWNVVDANNNVKYTVDKTYPKGTMVTEYPTELTDWEALYADRFVELPSLTPFTITADAVKEVQYEWTGPFQLTTDTDNPHLYYFKSARYSYYAYAPNSSTGQAKQGSQTKNAVTPRGRWFFTGDPFNGIEIRPYAYPETGLVNNSLSTTPTKYIPKTAPDITTNYYGNAQPSAAISFIIPNSSNCLAEQLGTWSASSVGTDKGLSFVVEEAEDVSMLVSSGLYRIRCMGDGLTSKYWKLDSDHKLYNNGNPDDRNTIFRIEENVNANNNLPESYYIAGFDGDQAWYMDNTKTTYSQQFTATQTAEDYMPAEIIYNAKSGDIPFFAIKLGTFESLDYMSYANTNSSLTTVVGWAKANGTADGSAWAIEPVDFAPTTTNIFTILNTNTYRGALMSAPSQSEKWVWDSGKNSQTFDATNPNCQWIFVPIAANQYALYNVGKQKFIVPTQSGGYNGYSWMFSSDAAPLLLFLQSNGTYKMNTVEDGIYVSVSNNNTGPIINYNDVGAMFTIIPQGTADSEVTSQLTNAIMAVPPVSKPMSLNAVGAKSYATLYLDYDAQTDASTKAYYITETENGYAKLIEVENEGRNIPAYTAVVLVNENGTTNPTFTTGFANSNGYGSVVTESCNLLKGTLTSMTLDLSDATSYYSMGKKDDKIGFYKFSGGSITLGANKAYLDTTAPGGAVKGFVFDLDEDPDAIVSPLGETEEGAALYNIAGQRMSKPQRGMNIINGKKIIIK